MLLSAQSLKKAASIIPLMFRLQRNLSRPEDLTELALDTDLIRPLQVKSELLEFARIIAARKPRCALEIGTCRGGTLLILSRLSAPDATIISVDLPGGRFGGGYRLFRIPIFKSFTFSDQKLYLIRGDSHADQTLSTVYRLISSRQLDFLFIDGDHTYQGVRDDYYAYSGFVKKGGIIAFHDIVEHPSNSGCEVSRFWSELKTQFVHREIIADRSQGWGGIGLLYV